MDEKKWRSLAETIHRILVILDDWLCEEFGFSRKARGKYTDAIQRTE